MADNQPENGDRFERFGSNMFRRCTHMCTLHSVLIVPTISLACSQKGSVIHGHWAIGIVLKHNLHCTAQ